MVKIFSRWCHSYYNTNIKSIYPIVNSFIESVKYIQLYDTSVDLNWLLDLHIINQTKYDINLLQHDLTNIINEDKFKNLCLQIKSQSISLQQLFETYKDESAGTFLRAIPKSKNDPTFMKSETFRTSALIFFLCELPSIDIGQQCVCNNNQIVDTYGIHIKKCTKVGNIYDHSILAHNNVVTIIQSMCEYNGFKTK